MSVSITDIEADELRALSVRTAYEAIAADLLRDLEPSRASLVLLHVAIIDAALAGDMAVLKVAGEVVQRLLDYASLAERSWRAPWMARLELLEQTVTLSCEGLMHERELALA